MLANASLKHSLLAGLVLGIVLASGPGGRPVVARGEYRMWADGAERNRIEAEYVEMVGTRVTLKRKRDGKLVKVRLEDLRTEDQQYVRNVQANLIIERAKRLKGQVVVRRSLPVVLLIGYPKIRQELGMWTVNGEPGSQELELIAFLDAIRNSPALTSISGNALAHLRPDESVEIAFQVIETLQPDLDDILDFGQRKRLRALGREYVFPWVTRPRTIDYVFVPAVQRDLELSAEQMSRLRDLTTATESESASGVSELVAAVDEGGQNRPLAATRIAENSRLEAEYLNKVLTPAQRNRIEQIRLQLEGTVELLANPALMSKLKFTPYQRRKIAELNRSLIKQALAGYFEGSLEAGLTNPDDVTQRLREDGQAQLRVILRDEQKQGLQRLLGDSMSTWDAANPFAAVEEEPRGETTDLTPSARNDPFGDP